MSSLYSVTYPISPPPLPPSGPPFLPSLSSRVKDLQLVPNCWKSKTSAPRPSFSVLHSTAVPSNRFHSASTSTSIMGTSLFTHLYDPSRLSSSSYISPQLSDTTNAAADEFVRRSRSLIDFPVARQGSRRRQAPPRRSSRAVQQKFSINQRSITNNGGGQKEQTTRCKRDDDDDDDGQFSFSPHNTADVSLHNTTPRTVHTRNRIVHTRIRDRPRLRDQVMDHDTSLVDEQVVCVRILQRWWRLLQVKLQFVQFSQSLGFVGSWQWLVMHPDLPCAIEKADKADMLHWDALKALAPSDRKLDPFGNAQFRVKRVKEYRSILNSQVRTGTLTSAQALRVFADLTYSPEPASPESQVALEAGTYWTHGRFLQTCSSPARDLHSPLVRVIAPCVRLTPLWTPVISHSPHPLCDFSPPRMLLGQTPHVAKKRTTMEHSFKQLMSSSELLDDVHSSRLDSLPTRSVVTGLLPRDGIGTAFPRSASNTLTGSSLVSSPLSCGGCSSFSFGTSPISRPSSPTYRPSSPLYHSYYDTQRRFNSSFVSNSQPYTPNFPRCRTPPSSLGGISPIEEDISDIVRSPVAGSPSSSCISFFSSYKQINSIASSPVNDYSEPYSGPFLSSLDMLPRAARDHACSGGAPPFSDQGEEQVDPCKTTELEQVTAEKTTAETPSITTNIRPLGPKNVPTSPNRDGPVNALSTERPKIMHSSSSQVVCYSSSLVQATSRHPSLPPPSSSTPPRSSSHAGGGGISSSHPPSRAASTHLPRSGTKWRRGVPAGLDAPIGVTQGARSGVQLTYIHQFITNWIAPRGKHKMHRRRKQKEDKGKVESEKQGIHRRDTSREHGVVVGRRAAVEGIGSGVLREAATSAVDVVSSPPAKKHLQPSRRDPPTDIGFRPTLGVAGRADRETVVLGSRVEESRVPVNLSPVSIPDANCVTTTSVTLGKPRSPISGDMSPLPTHIQDALDYFLTGHDSPCYRAATARTATAWTSPDGVAHSALPGMFPSSLRGRSPQYRIASACQRSTPFMYNHRCTRPISSSYSMKQVMSSPHHTAVPPASLHAMRPRPPGAAGISPSSVAPGAFPSGTLRSRPVVSSLVSSTPPLSSSPFLSSPFLNYIGPINTGVSPVRNRPLTPPPMLSSGSLSARGLSSSTSTIRIFPPPVTSGHPSKLGAPLPSMGKMLTGKRLDGCNVRSVATPPPVHQRVAMSPSLKRYSCYTASGTASQVPLPHPMSPPLHNSLMFRRRGFGI